MITTSIVLYHHSIKEIDQLIECLQQSKATGDIYVIDNSPVPNAEFNNLPVTYIFTGKNIGYGAAHNIAIRKSIEQNVTYHLVINPDITFDPNILATIEQFMDSHPSVAQLMPKVYYPSGETQYLCKLLPTPFDLIFRRFLPSSWTKKRTERFELRKSGYNKLIDVPYLSGCFMFLRTEALKEVGLFDERFFMYPEDIDLTRRIHLKFRTVFFPDVSIVHHHARGSYINFKMLYIHISNMVKYFNKWGWIFDKERKKINNKTLKQLN